MTKEEIIRFCEMLGPIYYDTPFAKMEKDKTPTLAFRHLKNKKIFVYCSEREADLVLAVKLDPERGENLRTEFDAVTPAWHMNKTHWSDLKIGKDLPNEAVKQLIEESYQLTR